MIAYHQKSLDLLNITSNSFEKNVELETFARDNDIVIPG